MINHDRAAASRFEGGPKMGEKSILKKLSQELTSLEGPASREVVKNIHDRSRNLATLHRTPTARKLLGPAIDPVFYDKKVTKGGVKIARNQKRPPKFIKGALPSQFSKKALPAQADTNPNSIRLV